jgi:hypothetical protein
MITASVASSESTPPTLLARPCSTETIAEGENTPWSCCITWSCEMPKLSTQLSSVT